MSAEQPPRTANATAARIRAADERLANRLREHGWTVHRNDESRVFVAPGVDSAPTIFYRPWPGAEARPMLNASDFRSYHTNATESHVVFEALTAGLARLDYANEASDR